MDAPKARFVSVSKSLAELVGEGYIRQVVTARAALAGLDTEALMAEATRPVEFYPQALHDRLLSLLPRVGEQIIDTSGLQTASGATTESFEKATRKAQAPLSGLGFYRLGEDGRLRLTTKSEHYHAPLGHSFPGYELLDVARQLGVPNATHNNTRGHITRLLEERLVRLANGLTEDDKSGFEAVMGRRDLGTLNRVLNLETGSLACEAALKLALARFYRSQEDQPEPPYAGRVPVVLVMGSDERTLHANYHGTTVLNQATRGMWPELLGGMEEAGLLRVAAVRPNHIEDLEAAFAQWEQPPYKLAVFFHEIVMMNYGARLLSEEFLRRAYALSEARDVPVVCDEIQSCVWSPALLQFREYGLRPSAVALGKGFPGGEYPASRLLFSAALDCLPQFGALVTNGQEELASLAYLITLGWTQANAEVTARVGDYYEQRLRELASRHPDQLVGIEGRRHMGALAFTGLEAARGFAARLVEGGLDASAQTYKSDCPPVVLTKLPLIACPRVVDFVVERMERALG